MFMSDWKKCFDNGAASLPPGLRDFLLLFSPIAVLVLAGTWMLGQSRVQAERSMLMAEERTYVDLSKGHLDQELAAPIRHLLSLVREEPVRRIYRAPATSDTESMNEAFLSLLSRNPDYDQVRWIDRQGVERVRVNNKGGHPYLVPAKELQNKRDRYFFRDTMQLEDGVIYISPLDLNMENGRIEIPYKPTLRVATPVFDKTGSALGILIINVAARSMLDSFVASAGPAAERLMLFNDQGYWLKSPDANDEWGFMFGRPLTLGYRQPQAWDKIASADSGQVLLSDGLWTWNSVSAVPVGATRVARNARWKVVSHLPSNRFAALAKQVWPAKLTSAAVLLSLFGIGIARLVQSKNARSEAEKTAALARKEAETANRVQEAQASFRMLFEANTSGLLVVNGDGRIIMTNPAFEQMFGYRLAEILQQPVEVLLPDSDREQHEAQRERYLRHPNSRAMGAGRELFGTHQNGKVFPIEIGLSPYRDNGQDFVLATIVDISERKRIQDELVRMNDVLEQRVRERTAELQTARREAEHLAEVKGDFLANMSHEIRTPLNAVLGLAYLLEQATLKQEHRDLVKKIRIAGRSLLGIINDILDFSKIESGRLEIEHAPFRLNDVLDNVATLMSAVEHSDDVELIMGPAPDDMRYLCGDALRLEQILLNLTSNALKFTRHGNVTLTITRLPKKDDRHLLRFSVSDTGCGIAPDKQEEIFTSFAQGDTSTTRRFGGTGLGLSICRCLVTMMGGKIGVVSELGKGSEFWFELPMEVVEPLEYVRPETAFQNVLIADDHPVAREMLAAIVRSLGWNPDVVETGEEAVQKIIVGAQNNKLPDLLLLDWRMPGMDGLETARRIKEILGDIPDAPIIMMATAHAIDQLRRTEGAELASAILGKPVTASALYNALSEARNKPLLATTTTQQSRPVNRRLAGLRVLVVDDSEINRDMARRILETEGAIVNLANDGRSALEFLRASRNRIDVVLMDIQMPVMDGYEATREIRQSLELTALPIIALTAGAFKNQQQAALAAGMNGFISKPFDVDALIAHLEQYVRNGGEENDQREAAPSAINPPRVTSTDIDLQRGLRSWVDADMYYKYLRKFAESHGRDGDQLTVLLQQGELEKALALTHTLKGTAGNLALMKVWGLAEQIERILTDHGTPSAWVTELQAALATTLNEIERLTARFKANPEPIVCVTASNAPEQLLRELLLALDRDNPDAAEPSLKALAKILPSQMLEPIRELLGNFDFRSAEEETQKLLQRLSAGTENN